MNDSNFLVDFRYCRSLLAELEYTAATMCLDISDSMLCIKVYIIALLLGFVKVQQYTESSSTANAQEAKTLCNLATPNITFAENGDTVSLDKSFTNELWVGYVKDYTDFLYIGCGDAAAFQNVSHTSDIIADPGHCHSFCNSRIIGIQRTTSPKTNTCYCLHNTPDRDDLNNACTAACEVPSNALCGDEATVSIYEIVHVPIEPTDVWTGSCLCYSPNAKQYAWCSCSAPYQRHCCQDANGTLIESALYSTWTWNSRHCIEAGSFPVDLNTDLSNIPTTSSKVWTGIIRSLSIYKVKEKACRVDNKQGYVQRQGNNFDLVFHASDSTTPPLHALCMEGEAEYPCGSTSTSSVGIHSTTPMVTEITDKNNSTEPSTLPDTPITDGSFSSTTSDISHVITTDSPGTNVNIQSNSNTSALVAVYIVVPLVIVLIVIGAGILVWRRRNCSQVKDTKRQEYNETSVKHNKLYNTQNGHAVDQDVGTVRHDYFVLEPADEYAAIKDTELDDTADGDYDTTKGTTMDKNDTGNIYNRLDGDPDDTYNHTNTNTTRDDDDTYNHTNTHNTRDDDTYNHTNAGAADTTYNTTETLSRSKQEHAATTLEGDYNTLNNDDDTYNHLNGDLSKPDVNPNADDTYNHPDSEMGNPKQVAHEYSYVEPSSTNPPPPNPGRGNMKYDYAYATKGATNGSTKPAMFKIDQLPNAGSYELAKEPPTAVNYELAKPPGV